jgi:hypothetical protein
VEPIVAVICDCDGTLAPDTTDFALREMGVDTAAFWREQDRLVGEGWDPPLAYLSRIVAHARANGGPTRDGLRAIGERVGLFPGLPAMFDEVRAAMKAEPRFADAGVRVEFYVISAGMRDVLEGTALAGAVDGIYACDLAYDAEGLPTGVKASVTFTEKTKFIYAINKGIGPLELRRTPYAVNDAIAPEERRVALANMVYIGDGPSDIPCMSVIKAAGGQALGVAEKARKGYELARGSRLTMGPYSPNFAPGSDMRRMLEQAVEYAAEGIVLRRQQTRRQGPGH